MNESKENKTRLFRRFGITTVVALYVLIAVGGIVRSTGSGMGCPDWPKCFGTWIPPTDVSQLPPDYKQQFKVQGKEIADFDAFKTWVEYVNRLIGALIGLFVFFTMLFSFYYLKKDSVVTVLSIASFLLVGFQGWLGSKVVSSNLAPFMITLHMLLALVIVAMLIYAVVRSHKSLWSGKQFGKLPTYMPMLVGTVLLFSLIQIALGTQVREQVDVAAKLLGLSMRSEWIEQLGVEFYIHRSFSLVITVLNIWLFLQVRKIAGGFKAFNNWAAAIVAIIGLEILSGTIMAYFAIPPYLQPVHLFLGSLMFGAQFIVALMLYKDILLGRNNSANRSLKEAVLEY